MKSLNINNSVCRIKLVFAYLLFISFIAFCYGPFIDDSIAVAPPNAPTNLKATADLTSGLIVLTWTDTNTTENGTKIYRSTGSGYVLAGTVGSNAATFSENMSGLIIGWPYTYIAYAYNNDGDSPVSNSAAFVRPFPDSDAPSDLTGGISSPTCVDLAWKDNSGNEAGFKIFRKTLGTSDFVQIGTTAVNVCKYSDNTILLDESYTYKVCAYRIVANSLFSNTLDAVWFIQSPSNLVAAVDYDTGIITLNWLDHSTNETGFKIERRSVTGIGGSTYSEVGTVGANVTTYTEAWVPGQTGYDYRVRAYNTVASTNYTNVASVRTDIPPAPAGFCYEIYSHSRIDLKWQDNYDKEIGYKIRRSDGVSVVYFTLPANSTSYSDINLKHSTTYTYYLQTVNLYGPGIIAQTAATIPGPDSPTPPRVVSTAPGEVTIEWSEICSGEYGFLIERGYGTGTFGAYGAPAVAFLPPNTTRFTDKGLNGGKPYRYRLSINKAGGYAGTGFSPVITLPGSVPAAPFDLFAGCLPSSSGITLNWTNLFIANSTGLAIERSTDPINGFVTIYTFNTVNVPVIYGDSNYTDNNVVSGTTYYYRVKCIGDGSESIYTNVAKAKAGTIVPNAVGDLLAAPGNTSVSLSWLDNSSDEDGFLITRRLSGMYGSRVDFFTVPRNTTTFTDTGLATYTSYEYKVRSYNDGGTSESIMVYPRTSMSQNLPGAPSALIANSSAAGGIALSWADNSSNETGFTLERSTNGEGPYSAIFAAGSNVTSHTDTAALAGVTYYYRVCAFNTTGSSTYSNTTSYLLSLPNPPRNFRAVSIDKRQVTLVWTDNSNNENVFVLKRRKSGGADPWVLVGNLAANTVEHIDSGLTPDTSYEYCLSAANNAGNSDLVYLIIKTLADDWVQGAIMINSGAKYTISRTVYLNLSATAGSGDMSGNGKMSFSTDGSTWSIWENYNTSREYELSKGKGLKTIYVKYMDRYNNQTTTDISASIQLAEPAKMTGGTYIDITTRMPGIAINFGQRAGIKMYNMSSGTSRVIHSMAGNPVPECKSMTRAKLTSSSYDDLVVDFGPAYGIWVCNKGKTWSNMPLHPLSAEAITAADINNDGKDELIVDFGSSVASPYKIWIYFPETGGWSSLHSLSPRSVSAGNLDGVSGSDLVLDFGIYGLWIYYNNANWVFLHSLTADQIVFGDINADGNDEVVVDFGELYGVWAYYPGIADPNLKWKFIESQNPKMMAIGNIDVDALGKKDIVIDYGVNDATKKSGIVIWANDTSFTYLHSLSSEGMVFSGNDLVVNFAGYGEWIYRGSLTQAFKWVFLEPMNAE